MKRIVMSLVFTALLLAGAGASAYASDCCDDASACCNGTACCRR